MASPRRVIAVRACPAASYFRESTFVVSPRSCCATTTPHGLRSNLYTCRLGSVTRARPVAPYAYRVTYPKPFVVAVSRLIASYVAACLTPFARIVVSARP